MGAENLEKKYGGLLPDKEDNFFPPLYNNDDQILTQVVQQTPELTPQPKTSTLNSDKTNNSEQKEVIVEESIEARKRRGK